MIIKKIFSIVLVFTSNILLASQTPSFLSHFNKNGRLCAEAVNATSGIPDIIIFNDIEEESDEITSLPKDNENPDFRLKKVTDKYFTLMCQEKDVALIDLTGFKGDFTKARICFYLNNNLRESYKTNFNPNIQASEVGNLLCLAEYDQQKEGQYLFKPAQRWMPKAGAKIHLPDTTPFQVKPCNDKIYQLLSQKIKIFVKWPSIPASKTLTGETFTAKPGSSVSAKTNMDKGNGNTHVIVISKHVGAWQRPAGEYEYPLKATLSSEDAYNAEKSSFKRKEIILYNDDELWINMGCALAQGEHYFLAKDMIGRCLTTDDCKTLSAAWLSKGVPANQDIFVVCDDCQYTHFQECRQLGSALYTLFLKISPQVRKAIEDKARGIDISKPKESEISLENNVGNKNLVIDKKNVVNENTSRSSSNFSVGKLLSFTVFGALLLLILHHQGIIIFNT